MIIRDDLSEKTYVKKGALEGRAKNANLNIFLYYVST